MERTEQDRPLEKRGTRRNFLKKLIGLSGDGEDTSLLDTAKLSVTVTLALAATVPVAMKVKDSTGTNLGNSGESEIRKLMGEQPITLFLLASVIAPLWEEGIFRVAPSFALNQLSKSGPMWRVGIPSSIAFASMHSFSVETPNPDEPSSQAKVQINSFPLYQFTEGMFFWKLVRDRGYLHGIVAHSTMNTVLLALTPLFPDPDNKEKPITNNPSQTNSSIPKLALDF